MVLFFVSVFITKYRCDTMLASILVSVCVRCLFVFIFFVLFWSRCFSMSCFCLFFRSYSLSFLLCVLYLSFFWSCLIRRFDLWSCGLVFLFPRNTVLTQCCVSQSIVIIVVWTSRGSFIEIKATQKWTKITWARGTLLFILNFVINSWNRYIDCLSTLSSFPCNFNKRFTLVLKFSTGTDASISVQDMCYCPQQCTND